MRLLILGATGRTGTEVVRQALATGHEVRALVRDPARLGGQAADLDVTVGDATDSTAVGMAAKGVDAVMVALGAGQRLRSDLALRAAEAIIPALHEAGDVRVIVMSSFGVGGTLGQASLSQRLLYRTVLRSLFRSKAAADARWRASGLPWTLVYPVTLTDGPRTGDYTAAEVLKPRGLPRISRADVADFMLTAATGTDWIRRTAILSG